MQKKISDLRSISAKSRRSPLSLRQRLLQQLLGRIRPAFVASHLKSVLRTRRVVCELEVGRFWIDPYSHFGESLTRDGEYEAEMCSAIERYLDSGGVFVDVGANEGFFSIVAGLKAGPTGKVIAVEPQSRLQPVIKKNLQLNNIDHAAVIRGAVSSERGMAEIHLAPDLNTGSSGFEKTTRYTVAKEKVRVMTLDEILEEAGVDEVHMMKMDIEGFEDDAILGAPELFQEGRVRVLALELHRRVLRQRGRDYRDVVRFLEAAGYSRSTDPGSGHLIQMLFARKDLQDLNPGGSAAVTPPVKGLNRGRNR